MLNPKFEIYAGRDGQFWFRLLARNGENILRSEGYVSQAGCRNGIRSVKENAPKDERYRRKQSRDGRHYFDLVAANGRIIGTSQMYTTKRRCLDGINAVKRVAPGAPTYSQITQQEVRTATTGAHAEPSEGLGETDLSDAAEGLKTADDGERAVDVVGRTGTLSREQGLELARMGGRLRTAGDAMVLLDMPVLAAFLRKRGEVLLRIGASLVREAVG
jgi:uncharacterized protein YegP (UPF0339 family)